MIVLTGLSVLCVTGCSSTRSVSASSRVQEFQGSRTTNITNEKDSVFVAEKDTLKEITVITINTNEMGDTVKVTQVTDRTRASVRDRAKEVEVKVVEKTDTVYIQKTDSVYVETLRQAQGDSGRASPLSYLKWIFWIVVAVTVMIALVKFRV